MDYLFVGAHPDDCELAAGGLIAKTSAAGNSAAIVDMTYGESGTRGTPEERQKESEEAAKILGVSKRIRLNLGDTLLENTEENRLEVIKCIRELRPKIIVYFYKNDFHPDHRKSAAIVRDAIYYSGLLKIETGQERFRPQFQLHFFGYYVASPTLIIDISEHFERKMEAIKAYKSQFYNPQYSGETTLISTKEFLVRLETRARYFGTLMAVKYAEPFYCPLPIAVSNPLLFLNK